MRCRPRIEGARTSPDGPSPAETIWTLQCPHFVACGDWADLVTLADRHVSPRRVVPSVVIIDPTWGASTSW